MSNNSSVKNKVESYIHKAVHVDKEKIKDDPRYCFGIPTVDNANYLWIQLFYSSLNAGGRA